MNTINKPTTITAAQWDTVAEAWQQGKAVIRDCFGDITSKIEQLPNGDYEATDIYGESWFVKPVSAKYGTFTVEWFTLPNSLPDPEDIADNERGEELVELFKRVEARLKYLTKTSIELGLPIAEETVLEQWLNSAADYLPMWYNDAIKDNAQLSLNQQPAAEPAQAAGEGGTQPLVTWATLPEKEQIALQAWINIDRVFVNEIEKSLQSKGLTRIVRIDHNRHQNMLTELGRAVLIQSGQNTWKFRKLSAGVSPVDYRETLSREGLLDYSNQREVIFEEIYQQEYDRRATLNTENESLRAELTTVKAERDAALKEAHKASKREEMADHIGDMYKEQYAQSRENAQLLYTTLSRVAPAELKAIQDDLWQSTNEYDKLMSEGKRWKEKHQRATWEIERLEAELAAAQLREAGLREALKQIALRSDLERPKKLEGEDGFSFGITHGLWRAGVIARKALAAGSEGAE